MSFRRLQELWLRRGVLLDRFWVSRVLHQFAGLRWVTCAATGRCMMHVPSGVCLCGEPAATAYMTSSRDNTLTLMLTSSPLWIHLVQATTCSSHQLELDQVASPAGPHPFGTSPAPPVAGRHKHRPALSPHSSHQPLLHQLGTLPMAAASHLERLDLSHEGGLGLRVAQRIVTWQWCGL